MSVFFLTMGTFISQGWISIPTNTDINLFPFFLLISSCFKFFPILFKFQLFQRLSSSFAQIEVFFSKVVANSSDSEWM